MRITINCRNIFTPNLLYHSKAFNLQYQNEALPRSSGLSRMGLIIFIILNALYLSKNYSKKINLLYIFSNIFVISIIGIIYTSLVAMMQTDIKKLIAYSSVAHMGYVTLGIFTFTKQGIEGSIYQMISHGLISAALFLCVGVVYDRLHSRMISTYGGIVNYLPKYSFLFIVFALAGLGLPGTSGFLGEFLVLTGTFQKSYLVAMLATFGVVLGAAYMLWLTKRVIFGVTKNDQIKNLKKLPGVGETIISKFEEFIKTGKLAALEKARENPINIFTKIYGVGPTKAKDLVKQGYTSIEELRKNES